MKEHLLEIIDLIPSGKVVSYGQVAEQLCMRYDYNTSGWLVGKMLSSLSKDEWHHAWQRVINKQGYISTLKLWERWLTQIALLQEEWIDVNNGYVDMDKHGWKYEKFEI